MPLPEAGFRVRLKLGGFLYQSDAFRVLHHAARVFPLWQWSQSINVVGHCLARSN